MITPELLTPALGGGIGFVAGRWWSEVFRGRYDASRVWKSRPNYRRK